MNNMLLAGLFLLIAGGIIIFSLLKNKKIIYSKDDSDKHKNIDENILKILKLKGYKILKNKKPSYNLSYNNRPAETRLEKTVFLKKAWNKYILFINNDEHKFVDNKNLRRKILEYNYASNLKGVIIINTIDKSLDSVSFSNKKEKLLNSWLFTMLILITISLTLNIFFLLNFIYGK